jgi:hypothetical protein
MRKITTAITAAALAFSMLASAVPAAAVVGYDSAYAGESAFVNITGGQTQNFQVFFANTGTTAWQRGTASQVDLAACLEDKVTCNAQDASEATWNSGWLSATRYATSVQTITPPGSLGTFSYNITAPAGVAAGIYRFNGDLVLASTGEKIHPDGYYQEANTGGSAGAPTITSLTPNSGPAGTDVVIAGSGFICTPAFPTVSFGGTNGTVLSCGATSITTDAPAHALGTVTVTASNSGSGASNGLAYTYTDVTGPTFLSFTVSGDVMTATFSEPVCAVADATPADWTVRNISGGGTTDYTDTGATSTIPLDCDDAVSTYTIFLNSPIPNGAFVEATLEITAAGINADITDASGNEATAPQSRQTTVVAPETTKPTLVSATGSVGSSTITLTFSEPVYCPTLAPATDITVDDTSSTTDPTVAGYGSDPCSTLRSAASTTFNISIAPADLEADTSYQITFDVIAGDVLDFAGNSLADGATVTFTSGAGDFTPPTMVDARVAANVGTTDFREDDDSFTVTFSEVMDDDLTNDSLQLQDQDGTVITVTCTGGVNNVVCDWNDAVTTLSVTVNVATLTVPALGELGVGTTPGMQIPFNITTLTGFMDAQGNVPNVLGSSDRLVDYE